MQNRRCAVCNAWNEADAVYCVNCHSFLHGRAVPGGEHVPIPSVWELDPVEQTAIGRTGTGQGRCPRTESSERREQTVWYAVCPDCQTRIRLEDRRMPLCCGTCGYLFQLSDRPVRAEDLNRGKTDGEGKADRPDAHAPARPASPAPASPRESGPMRRAQRDQSTLRLISMSLQASFVLTAREEGNVLGTRGNLSPDLFRNGAFRAIAPQHIMVWHAETGWYLRPIGGQTIHNGEALNMGISRKLSDGDLLNVGDCSIRVEIVSRTE